MNHGGALATRVGMVLSDIHIPHADASALNCVLEAIKDLRPRHITLLGDIIDCYALSRFDKDPARVESLQFELDEMKSLLANIKRLAPKGCELMFVAGNHEHRLHKWLCAHPEVAPLRALEPTELFGINACGWSFCDYMGHIEPVKNFVLAHGHVVRKGSAYSARAQLMSYGKSGISGHTHRLGLTCWSFGAQRLRWAENGCLCKLDPDYIHAGTTDWQHGFSCWFEDAAGNVDIQPVEITDGRARLGRTVYKGR